MSNIKQNLLFISLCILIKVTTAQAEQPHLEATPACPIDEVCCPAKIYCSFKEGCGETTNWIIDAGVNDFEGVHPFALSKITANRLWYIQSKSKGYMYSCLYKGKLGIIDLSNDDGYKLNGNWVYSGFMNNRAECTSTNPVDCTGIKLP